MAIINQFNAFRSGVLAALLAMVLLGWSSPVRAQYQIQGGHALDANPRVGSGGDNGVGTPHNNYNVNNNIVTGNVSGLSYFHGNTNGEFDPSVFEGNTGTSGFDRFNAISAPVNYSQKSTGIPTYTPYYDNNITVAPPSNSVITPGGLGYIPAPVVSPLTPQGYDTRLELLDSNPTQGNLQVPGELNVAGPVDPSGNASMFSMSPLYGVRPADNTSNNQSSIFNQTTNTSTLTPADRSRLSPAQVQQMRDELNTTVVTPDQSAQPNGTAQPNTNGQPGINTNVAQPPVSGAVDVTSPQVGDIAVSPNNLSSQQPLSSVSVNNQQLTNGVASGESLQNQLIVPPAQQSKQLAALEKQFAKDKQSKLSDVEATERLNAERHAQMLGSVGSNGKPALATPQAGKTDAGNPNDNTTTATPAKPILTTPTPTEDNQPYLITSLATGINAKGLAGLMKTGEDLMRQGKFTEAVDTYDTAEQVAPNNAFVALGRGLAEMGASYYGKADQDLTRAITTDPAILVGHYDLKGFLGEDRLKFVHDDLSDIADHEKGARPLVLLAFIAHNNGDDTLTTKDLAEAEKRGGYADTIKTMREAWNLGSPATQPAQ